MGSDCFVSPKDWVSDSRTYALAWGLPGVILIVGIFLDPLTRTVMWAGALLWKEVLHAWPTPLGVDGPIVILRVPFSYSWRL